MSTFVAAESGAQLVARISSEFRPNIGGLCRNLFPDGGPLAKRIIEIFGESNTGKTHYLMELMARAILPLEYGGRNCHVVFFSLDGNFKLFRFLGILEKVVGSSDSLAAPENVKEVVENSLKNLQIYNCYSCDEYQLAMLQLDDLLTTNSNIALVAFDSICAFYWLDCKEKNALKMETHYKRTIQALKKVCKDYKVVCAFTRPAYFASAIRTSTTGTNSVDYKVELIAYENEGIRGIEAKMENFNGQTSNQFFVIGNMGISFVN